MTAIFKREFKSFFTTPLGYVILIIFNLFSGIYFWFGTLYSGSVDMSYVYSGFTLIVLAALPIITMRLLSEERRQKTDQALLTAPVSLFGIVFSKFLAALALYVIGISVTLVYSVVLAFVAQPAWNYILGNYLGLVLLGAALLSVGLFISSITENQLVAAIVSYAAMFLMLMSDTIANLFPVQAISEFFYYLSYQTRYDEFVSGVVSADNVMFFVSTTAIFIFLTTRVMEKRRWS
ncbi:MAG: ABC transporter permease subunit [Oscillospiraceae bacterium]|nr:ABC transporter permease subunit [Oscillospiraceae bacterium]